MGLVLPISCVCRKEGFFLDETGLGTIMEGFNVGKKICKIAKARRWKDVHHHSELVKLSMVILKVTAYMWKLRFGQG